MSDTVPPNVADMIIRRVALIAAGVDATGKPAEYSVKETLEAARLVARSTKSSNGKPSSGEPWIVQSLTQVGEFFDRAEDTIKEWRERGMPGEPGGPKKLGRYDLKECLLWRDATIGPTGRNDGIDPGEETRADGDRRKSLAEAAIKEMKAAVMRGELIDVNKICREYVHSATHTRAMLEQMPHRFMSCLIEQCPHCGEQVYSGDDKRRILEANKGHVDDAIEAVHSCLTARMDETPDTEES